MTEIVIPWSPKEHPDRKNGSWAPEEIEVIRAGVESGKTHKDIAALLGRSENAVRGRAHIHGIVRDRSWTKQEEESLRSLYEKSGENGVLDLTGFANSINRNKANVCRKAKQLGLPVSPTRKHVEERKDRRKFKGDKEAVRRHISESMRQHIKEKGHPRGALGYRHTEEAIRAMSEKSRAANAALTPEQRVAINLKIMKTRLANGTYATHRPHGSWKAGWHEIGGKRCYYRSNWEANYARYLQWLKEKGQISDWKHEPKTFWFEGVKRGTVSYLPDFWVLENDGRDGFHEVKGWMDDRSKTKIARMAKYYPDVSLIVVDAKAYREIRRKVSSLVPGWYDTPRDRRGA